MLDFYLISMVRSEPIQVFIAYTRHIRHDPNHRQQRPETSGSARAVPQIGTRSFSASSAFALFLKSAAALGGEHPSLHQRCGAVFCTRSSLTCDFLVSIPTEFISSHDRLSRRRADDSAVNTVLT